MPAVLVVVSQLLVKYLVRVRLAGLCPRPGETASLVPRAAAEVVPRSVVGHQLLALLSALAGMARVVAEVVLWSP